MLTRLCTELAARDVGAAAGGGARDGARHPARRGPGREGRSHLATDLRGGRHRGLPARGRSTPRSARRSTQKEGFSWHSSQQTRAGQDAVLATVARLVTAADGDTLYRDVYLRRAAELLVADRRPRPTTSRAVTSREQLDEAARAGARGGGAPGLGAGPRARDARGRHCSARWTPSRRRSPPRRRSTGRRPCVLDPLSPGLTSFSKRWSDAGAGARGGERGARGARARRCRGAASCTRRGSARSRRSTVAGAAAPAGRGADRGSAAPPRTSSSRRSRRSSGATRRPSQGLAESMLGTSAADARPADEEAAPTARARIAAPDVLGEPLPEACLSRAKALGLEPVEVDARVAGGGGRDRRLRGALRDGRVRRRPRPGERRRRARDARGGGGGHPARRRGGLRRDDLALRAAPVRELGRRPLRSGARAPRGAADGDRIPRARSP